MQDLLSDKINNKPEQDDQLFSTQYERPSSNRILPPSWFTFVSTLLSWLYLYHHSVKKYLNNLLMDFGHLKPKEKQAFIKKLHCHWKTSI